jgi:hypothetical protein
MPFFGCVDRGASKTRTSEKRSLNPTRVSSTKTDEGFEIKTWKNELAKGKNIGRCWPKNAILRQIKTHFRRVFIEEGHLAKRT